MYSYFLKTMLAFFVLSQMCSKQLDVYREKTFCSYSTPHASERTLLHSAYPQLNSVVDGIAGMRVGINFLYFQSLKKSGEYWGAFNEQRGVVESFVGVDEGDPFELLGSRNIIHDCGQVNPPPDYGLKDRIKIEPQIESMAAQFHALYGFDRFFEGFYLFASGSLVKVVTRLGAVSTYDGPRLMRLPGTMEQVSVGDYLSGLVENLSPNNMQQKLTRLKVDHQPERHVAMSDVDCGVRVRLWEKKGSNVNLSCGTILPLDVQWSGQKLFDAQTSNGGHAGFFLSVDMDYVFWAHDDASIETLWTCGARYLLDHAEYRTPMIKNAGGALVSWGQYQLAGQVGRQGVFPLANVLYQKVMVTPGQELELNGSLMYQQGGLTIEVGTGVTARTREYVSFTNWQDNTYAIANFDYDTKNAFNIDVDGYLSLGGKNAPIGQRAINRENLDASSIETPATLIHSLFATLNYVSFYSPVPVVFGCGCSWDIHTMNNARDRGLTIFFRSGVTF